MEKSFLLNTFVFLAATSLVLPIAGRFKLGSVLGYLLAGILIGPFGIGLIAHAEAIMHLGEFGVVMMLFIIGLELDPQSLWRLRKFIVGLGGLQVLLTSFAFLGIGIALGFEWKVSLVCGMALSLSSTALVLQMLREKDLLQTSAGESSFAVLLFQDIAVIPILILMPLLVSAPSNSVHGSDALESLPGWAHTIVIAGVILSIVMGGRYLSRHLFRYAAKTHLREVFTAISLALVVGIALLMQMIGISPALGAFVAGVVLANSEYKHTLETDIEPFKGLLLSLFFVSIGIGMDFALLGKSPMILIGMVLGLIIIKMVILWSLGFFFKLGGPQKTLFALALAQGGEFAFVLFQYARGLHLLSSEQKAFLTLVVGVSMALSPFLMIFNDRFIVPRFMSRLPEREPDRIEKNDNPVIIAGYGRFGQVIGRFLSAQGIQLTILEMDPDQIELLRRFGNKVYFGDASRLDLLRSSGAEKAKLLVVAVDDADKTIEIARLSKKEFPNLKVFARARNRRHAYELYKAGVNYFRRETFDSSLVMAQEVMIALGSSPSQAEDKALKFMRHDENSLKTSFAFFEQEPELIHFAQQTRYELERILQNDLSDEEREKKTS